MPVILLENSGTYARPQVDRKREDPQRFQASPYGQPNAPSGGPGQTGAESTGVQSVSYTHLTLPTNREV